MCDFVNRYTKGIHRFYLGHGK